MIPRDKYLDIAAMIAGSGSTAPPRIGGRPPGSPAALEERVSPARVKYGLTDDPCVNVEILRMYAEQGDEGARRLLGREMAACRAKREAEAQAMSARATAKSEAREAVGNVLPSQNMPAPIPPEDTDLWLRWLQVRKREPREGWMPKFKGGY